MGKKTQLFIVAVMAAMAGAMLYFLPKEGSPSSPGAPAGHTYTSHP